jgi:hypothetical protein
MADPGDSYGVTPKDIRDAAYGLKIPEGDTVDLQIQKLIDKAADRLDSRVPSLHLRVTNGTLKASVVQGVIEDMVLRVLRNPKAFRSLGIDDFQTVIDNSTSTGLLYVSGDDLSLLRPRTRSKFGSIRLGVPGWRQPGVDC